MNHKNINKGFILYLVFSCLPAIILAQEPEYRATKIIPPSPTAASITKYGNTPVSYYSGTADISIPLYDVTTQNHSLKIGLQYDASGTKARQDASWVGLGWTLKAGGAITRTVRHQDDFIGHGYYNSQALPANTSGNDYQYSPSTVTTDKFYFDNVYDGQMDSEPDLFSYSFGPFSGKFVLGKKINGSVVFSDRKNNMDFTYTDGRWIATDGEGNKYYFGTFEMTQDYYLSSSTELTNFNGVDAFNRDINSSPVTAWYLDSIVAPTAEKISFSYVHGKSLSLVNQSEIFIQLGAMVITGCTAQTPQGMSNNFRSYDASRQEIRDAYLQKITFANGTIEFKVSERNDISYLNNADGLLKPSKLDSIIVKTIKGDRIKAYAFYYSYFQNWSQDKRLKLDSIAELGTGVNRNPPYSFSYINPDNIAPTYTKNIDHWGYYNGIVNPTLLPTTTFPLAPLSFIGADRSADTSANYAMNGVLYAIKYPTGGSTNFEYELHDYSNLHGEQAYRTVDKSATVRSNSNNPGGDITSVNFRIPPLLGAENQKVPVTIQCSYQKVDPDVSDLVSLGYSNLWKVADNGSLQSVGGCTTANYGQPNPSPTFNNRNVDTGNYRMHIQATNGWSFFMSVSWQEKEPVPITYRKGGGIRIKRITDQDGIGNQTVRRFVYKGDDGISSGVLLSTPVYSYYFDITGSNYIIGTGIVIPCDYTARYYGVQSATLLPPGLSSQSNVIGYSKVTELLGENGENGKTAYYYHNEEDAASTFATIPNVGDPLNGTLNNVIVYNAQGDTVKRNDYGYLSSEGTVLKGVKLMTIATVADAKYVYRVKFYDNVSSWVTQISDTETVFNGVSKIVHTKATSYANNIHREPTEISTTRSDGSTLITKFKRPSDYTVTGNLSFVEKMRGNHIFTPVIEQETFLQRGSVRSLVSGTFTSYKQYFSKFFKPDLLYKIEAAAPLNDLTESSFISSTGQPVMHVGYKPNVYFDAYSEQGNLLSYHESNNISQSYFWGYNSQYPIAKVEGADYNTAKQYIISPGILDNPADDQTLRTELNRVRTGLGTNALVTTYTYLPLLGATSVTDPSSKTLYYEYDAFGRLKVAKDKDGKIVMVYDYQYQKPVSQ